MTLGAVLLFGSLLAAQPDALSVAVPDLAAVDVEPGRAAFLTSHFAQAYSEAGARVVTSRDIQAALGMERQRQLLGCAGDEGCMVEIASALGVDAISAADVARIGEGRYQLSLRLVASATGERLADYSSRVDGEEALLDELTRAARKLAAAASDKLEKPLRREAPAAGVSGSAGSARRWAWAPLVGAGVAAGIGGFFLVRSEDEWTELQASRDPTTARQHANAGGAAQLGARVAFGIAGAAALGAAAMFAFGGESPASVAAAAGPDELALVFSVRWP